MGKKVQVAIPKRVPRKKKKVIKGSRIVYDVASFPDNKGLTMEGIMQIYDWYGVILWDSSKGGQKPQILVPAHTKLGNKLKLIDVA